MTDNVDFLNWYVGILMTLIGLLFTGFIFFVKNEFLEYKEKNKRKDRLENQNQEELRSLKSTLELTREKILTEIINIKDKIKDIPQLNESLKTLQIEFTKLTEQIKYIQKDLDKTQKSDYGKIIIKEPKN